MTHSVDRTEGSPFSLLDLPIEVCAMIVRHSIQYTASVPAVYDREPSKSNKYLSGEHILSPAKPIDIPEATFKNIRSISTTCRALRVILEEFVSKETGINLRSPYEPNIYASLRMTNMHFLIPRGDPSILCNYHNFYFRGLLREISNPDLTLTDRLNVIRKWPQSLQRSWNSTSSIDISYFARPVIPEMEAILVMMDIGIYQQRPDWSVIEAVALFFAPWMHPNCAIDQFRLLVGGNHRNPLQAQLKVDNEKHYTIDSQLSLWNREFSELPLEIREAFPPHIPLLLERGVQCMRFPGYWVHQIRRQGSQPGFTYTMSYDSLFGEMPDQL
ncbi:hypothetical protein F5Y18DRAFT_433972 [Xylariaceae sp. FL1019]|nr:hypothetical protein F5Y18DRAFT_433972 [Xylariaceae sp. FL1019]